MIRQLITRAIQVLVATLAGEIPDPSQHIRAGPVEPPPPDQLPIIALTPGNVTVVRRAMESQNSQPRPQNYRQRMSVNDATPAGPYSLDHQPLQGTARATAIYDEGEVAEQRSRLQEAKDFTIDYSAQTVTFIDDLAGADTVVLTYSFVGIFTVQDFEQVLLVDVYAATIAEVEELTSLTTGTLLTFHDELVDTYNNDPLFQTVYTAGDVTTTHQLRQFYVVEGQMVHSPQLKMGLTFTVSGQMTAARAITEGFGLIEKIHSPGLVSEHPVDIEIELDV